MTKTTMKELKRMVRLGYAEDLTYRSSKKDYDDIMEKEGYLTQIQYASGIYGCNGKLLKGNKTGTLYAITCRSTALYIY